MVDRFSGTRTDDPADPGVTVVLPTCGDATFIDAQLAALAGQTCTGSWELIVVDNGCSDDARGRVIEWTDRIPTLRIVDAVKRSSVSHARNVGAAASAAPLLAFCDDDDVVDASWLGELVATSSQADAVTGTLTLDELNDPEHAEWRGFGALGVPLPRKVCLWGGNFLIRRDAFEDVGGFDEDFVCCGEDIDLDFRLRQKGWTIARNDRAFLQYRLRSSISGIARQSFRYGESFALVCKKHGAATGVTRPFSLALKTWGWLILNSWSLATSRRRGRWTWVAGRSLGRIRGSIRYRVMCL